MILLSEGSSFRRILTIIVAVVCVLSLLRQQTDTSLFVDRLYNRPPAELISFEDVPARLESSQVSTETRRSHESTLDIVVSMYKEESSKLKTRLEEIRSLKRLEDISIATFVYAKDADADISQIRNELNASHVSLLDNTGREASTYFTHILREWDNLARHTLFIQADMHDFEGAKSRINEWFTPRTGVLPLGQVETCDCVKCTDPWDPEREFPRIEELYSALNGEFCPPKITLSYQGQIIASASRIRARKPSTYQYLKSVLDSDMQHFIHSDPRQSGTFGDDQSNPYFGHTVERSYMVLWNCSDEGVAERCGDVDALRAKGSDGMPDDYCQCLDLDR